MTSVIVIASPAAIVAPRATPPSYTCRHHPSPRPTPPPAHPAHSATPPPHHPTPHHPTHIRYMVLSQGGEVDWHGPIPDDPTTLATDLVRLATASEFRRGSSPSPSPPSVGGGSVSQSAIEQRQNGQEACATTLLELAVRGMGGRDIEHWFGPVLTTTYLLASQLHRFDSQSWGGVLARLAKVGCQPEINI